MFRGYRHRLARSLKATYSPRLWSNDALRGIAGSLTEVGSILNVSGWKDGDKEGNRYRDYFPSCTDYRVSNHPDDTFRGISAESDLVIDLAKPISEDLFRGFDLVFSHTVLEHLRNPESGFSKICSISRRYVLTVVPFVQGFHFSPGNFGDYFRFTPMALREMHEDNGFQVIQELWGPRRGPETYLLQLGSRAVSDEHAALVDLESMNHWVGMQAPLDRMVSAAAEVVVARAQMFSRAAKKVRGRVAL